MIDGLRNLKTSRFYPCQKHYFLEIMVVSVCTQDSKVSGMQTVHLFIIITNTSLANTSSEKKIGYEKRWNLALPLIPSSVFTTKTSKVRINISF